jgi:prepilin-type N-terminal cleavage/methylation domain-containing protein
VRSANRPGFTLIEAAIAVAIVGITTIGALEAFGAELRTADRVRRSLEADALAQERLAALELTEPALFRTLPDSLTRGAFAAPFADYSWSATVKSDRNDTGLFDVVVHVVWPSGGITLQRTLYRPLPQLLAR